MIRLHLLLAAAFIFSTVGCATMSSNSAPPVAPESDGHAASHQSAGAYKVIFGNTKGTPEVFNGTIAGNMTMQDALNQSGARKKFKHLRVDLARRTDSGRVLKLPVNIDPETGQVLNEQNYAVHPGDEILVRKEPNPGMLDSVFKSIGGAAF